MNTEIKYNSDIYKRSRTAYTLECAFEYFIALIVADSFLARLLKSIGFSDSSIGIISSLISLSFVFQIVALPILRRISRLKLFAVLMHGAGQFSFMLIYLIPYIIHGKNLGKATAVILILIAYFGNYSVSSLIYKWGNSFVDRKKLGFFGARKEMISLLSGISVQLVSGMAVDYFSEKNNINGAFIFCAVSAFVYCTCDLICLLLIAQRDSDFKYKSEERFSDALKYVSHNKPYKATVLLSCLFSAGMYSVVGFVGTYKIQDLCFNMTVIQIINIASCLSRFAVSVPFGKYTDKTSFVKANRLGLYVMAASSFFLLFTGPGTRYLIIFYSVLYNMSLAGTHANILNMTYLVVDERYFTDSLAIKNAISGTVGFLTSVICGKVLNAFQLKERYLFGINFKGQQLLGLFSLIIITTAIVYSKKRLQKLVDHAEKGSKA